MCRIITVPSLVWLRRTARRWRRSGAAAAKLLLGETVPAGHVAVRVEGGGAGRFVVPVAHLNHPEFRELLRQAEEEYGFPPGASGPVALLCDEERLRDVLRRVDRRVPSVTSSRRGEPLLQGMAVEKLLW